MQGMPFRAVNQGSRNNIAETVKIKKKKKDQKHMLRRSRVLCRPDTGGATVVREKVLKNSECTTVTSAMKREIKASHHIILNFSLYNILSHRAINF